MAATARHLREDLALLLESNDWPGARANINALPAGPVAGVLPCFLCSPDARTRWRAVQAMGDALERMARTDMECARSVLRRLLWSLNDESGGIGWGAAEAMGEAVARHADIAREFGPILMALLREDGYHLQYAPAAMQQGALWAVCRAAAARPGLLDDQAEYLLEYLDAPDSTTRALAARALGLLRCSKATTLLKARVHDNTQAVLDDPSGAESTAVSREAIRALEAINGSK